jgi:hypothetical protein
MAKLAGIPVLLLIAVPAWSQEPSPVRSRASTPLLFLDDVDDASNRLPTTLGLFDGEPQAQGEKKQGETEVLIQANKLSDDLPVGPYHRPFWTAKRPSPTTRIYLQVDPDEVEFEQWVDIRPRQYQGFGQPKVSAVRMSEEFEFGLGGRFQLDLYMNTIFERQGFNSTLEVRNWSAEIRYALADWGVIPTNPTLYLEYILWNNQPGAEADQATSSLEGKLLLGDDLGDYWHWGSNLFCEHTLNSSVLETGVTLSVFRTIIDGVLSAGFATQYVYESDKDPGNVHIRFRGLYVGPSLQYRFANREVEEEQNGQKTKKMRPRAHLDIEPLIGVTHEADEARVQLVFGWDF